MYTKMPYKMHNLLSKTKIVSFELMHFFHKNISDLISVQIAHHTTPNSQLVAPVTFDSISQLPILGVSTSSGHNRGENNLP